MNKMLEYECPVCGGSVKFDSATQKLVCPYCDSTFDPQEFGAQKEQEAAAQKGSGNWDEHLDNWTADEAAGMYVYHCDSCGGDIVGDETLASTHCPYCDNPVVMMGQFGGDLRPNCVIPFKLDKKAAEDAFLNHTKGKKLVPKIFRSKKHIEEVQGLYVPYWVTSAKADCDVVFDCTVETHTSDSQNDYYKTDTYLVERGGTMDFENIPVEASSKHEAALLESIEPFNFADAVPFNSAYLAGYLADRYDIDADSSRARAEERMKNSMAQAFEDTLSAYDSVQVRDIRIAYRDGRVDYCLLPVWFLNTRWKGQLYRFAMNGQTGKLKGDLPIDNGAVWKWRGIWFLVFLIIGLIIAYFITPYIGIIG